MNVKQQEILIFLFVIQSCFSRLVGYSYSILLIIYCNIIIIYQLHLYKKQLMTLYGNFPITGNIGKEKFLDSFPLQSTHTMTHNHKTVRNGNNIFAIKKFLDVKRHLNV
jgi:hypothetical protein